MAEIKPDTKAAKAQEGQPEEADQASVSEEFDRWVLKEDVSRRAELLRRAEGPADAARIRSEWRHMHGEDAEIGDFLLHLVNGEVVRTECVSTRHNGHAVIGVYEDPQ